MEDPLETSMGLVEGALEGYRAEYKELSETWNTLDAKAQGNVGICGLFLAGMLAFVRALTHSSDFPEKLGLSVMAILLIMSIYFAVKVLRVQDVPGAPVGESLKKHVQDLLRLESPIPAERLLNFGNDQTKIWDEVNAEIRQVNSQKAVDLTRAQIVLQWAIIFGVMITLYRIWSA